jgi:hypothetical protein
MRRPLVAGAVAVALVSLFGFQTPADASYLLARDAEVLSLKVNAKGIALITFRRANGGVGHVLAWGAVNARHPNRSVPQVKFKVDYSGGWKSFGAGYWKRFRDVSLPYDGPALPWLVTARKAPDGSYWGLQRWQRMLWNYGVPSRTRMRRAWELRLSHWSGPLPQLDMWTDWTDAGAHHHLFGRYTYQGVPVYGFSYSATHVPQDAYGRNVYLDTHNSAYGPGWKRENSKLTYRPNGQFCYTFQRSLTRWGIRPPGNGDYYRATAIGPGVTPDPYWEGPGLPRFNSANLEHLRIEASVNAIGASLWSSGPARYCAGP